MSLLLLFNQDASPPPGPTTLSWVATSDGVWEQATPWVCVSPGVWEQATEVYVVDGWTPGDISGLELWTRSDQGLTIEATDKVAAWADLSGNGHDLLLDVDRPTLLPAAFDGHDALSFDGVNDSLVASFPLARPATVILVVRLNTWALNDVLFDGVPSNVMLLQCSTTSPTMRIFSGLSISAAMPIAAFTAMHAFFDVNASPSSSLQFDNDAAATGSIGNAAAPNGFRLGRRGSGNASDMDVVEVLVVNRGLTAPETALLRGYLAGRYPSLGLV